jgi:hypothetical protein
LRVQPADQNLVAAIPKITSGKVVVAQSDRVLAAA